MTLSNGVSESVLSSLLLVNSEFIRRFDISVAQDFVVPYFEAYKTKVFIIFSIRIVINNLDGILIGSILLILGSILPNTTIVKEYL